MRIFFTAANITTKLIECCTDITRAGLKPALVVTAGFRPVHVTYFVPVGQRPAGTLVKSTSEEGLQEPALDRSGQGL